MTKEEKIKHSFKFTPVDIILIIAVIMIGVGIAISNYQFEVTRQLSKQLTKIDEYATRQNVEIAKQIDAHELSQANRTNVSIEALLNASERNYQAIVNAEEQQRLKIDQQTNQTFRYLNAELADLNEDVNLLVAAQNLTAYDRIVNNGTHIFIKNDTKGAITSPIPLGQFGIDANATQIFSSQHLPFLNTTTTPQQIPII